jgi:3-deoxy-manno-octulosonate cytidylyltransferase (CMP-KDO synthetase)
MQVNLLSGPMGKALGIIPARWGSTRFPGKPLYSIAGKPLLRHVWERCQHAIKLDALIVATDDMRVAKAAFDWGAEVAVTSPKHRSGTDRVAEVASHAKNFEFVINIQGDEPLIDPRLIDNLVDKLQSDRKIDIVTAAHPFSNPTEAESPHQNKVVLDQGNCALYFSRSVIPYSFDRSRVRYLRHQGIYAFRRDALLRFVKWEPTPLERAESLEQLRALENGVKIHVLVIRHGSPGVDTPADANSVAASLREAPSRSREKKYHHVAHRATATGRRTS